MWVVEDKVALVTGGSGGIGFAVVKELLKNGAKGVAIVDLAEELSIEALEEIKGAVELGKVIFIKADVTIKNELESAFEKTIIAYQQLDIVFNNAGIANEVDWKNTLAVNLGGVIEGSFLAMQKYLPKYKSTEEGIIVNTASILGLTTMQSVPIYCAAKHGVVSFGEALGGDEYYNKYKVRVLTICPGVVNTKMVAKLDPATFPFFEKTLEDLEALNSIMETPASVAEAFIEIISKGKTGSVWVKEEGNPPYEVEIPARSLCVKRQ